VPDVPALAAFRADLSRAALAAFDLEWERLVGAEATAHELLLRITDADPALRRELVCVRERFAIRSRLWDVLEEGGENPFDEMPDSRTPGRSDDGEQEIAFLEDLAHTAAALAAMLRTHSRGRRTPVADGPFAALGLSGRPATTDEVHRAAGWEPGEDR
jgi:hypothetical protein